MPFAPSRRAAPTPSIASRRRRNVCLRRKASTCCRPRALPENYFTVWHNLFERGALKSGESALIHGGASGIGTTAIQLAKAFGATVFTTVRNEDKAKAVRALGADHAILYKDNDWAAEVKKLSGGVDVVARHGGGRLPCPRIFSS